jgi:hypothetical protein
VAISRTIKCPLPLAGGRSTAEREAKEVPELIEARRSAVMSGDVGYYVGPNTVRPLAVSGGITRFARWRGARSAIRLDSSPVRAFDSSVRDINAPP